MLSSKVGKHHVAKAWMSFLNHDMFEGSAMNGFPRMSAPKGRKKGLDGPSVKACEHTV
jgi:hypothetical protein